MKFWSFLGDGVGGIKLLFFIINIIGELFWLGLLLGVSWVFFLGVEISFFKFLFCFKIFVNFFSLMLFCFVCNEVVDWLLLLKEDLILIFFFELRGGFLFLILFFWNIK